MLNGSNRDQNSQHSGILTEPLNPLDLCYLSTVKPLITNTSEEFIKCLYI